MKYDLIAEKYVIMTDMWLSEDVLMEDRIDYLKQMHQTFDTSHDTGALHKSANDIIDHFANNADPTRNKVHTHYILGLYKRKAIRQSDAPRINSVLTDFDRYKQFLSPDKKQLNPKTYPTIDDIHREISQHFGKATTNKEAREQLRNNPLDVDGHRQVYADRNINVYNVSDEGMSQKMYASATASKPGAFPTEWCTAWMKPRECQLNKYRNIHGGDVFSVHHTPDKTVYQYHTNTNQFMNAKNEWIGKDEWDKIRPSVHKMWEENPHLLDNGENNKPDHLAFLAKYGKAKHVNSALERLNKFPEMDPTDLLNIHRGAAENDLSTVENYKKITEHPKFNAEAMASNRVRNPKFLSYLSKHENPLYRAAVAANRHLPQEDLERLSHENGHPYALKIRYNAMQNQNASSEHVNRALNDKEELIRMGAIEHHGHKLDADRLNHILMTDTSPLVVMKGMSSHKDRVSKETLEHLGKHHPSEAVRNIANVLLGTK